MKRQFAFLFALTFMVSGMATIAEQTAAENAQTEVTMDAVTSETRWIEPFVDGAWLDVPEWNAEVYLPVGWMLAEVTESGFTAADAEGASMMTAVIEEFDSEDGEMTEAAADEAASENTEEAVDETAGEAADETAAENSDEAAPSAFETYMLGVEEAYELVQAGEREYAVLTGEESVSVKFVVNGRLVTLTFAPADESGIAGSALSVAETFYVYDAAEETAETAETAEEAAEASEEEAAE